MASYETKLSIGDIVFVPRGENIKQPRCGECGESTWKSRWHVVTGPVAGIEIEYNKDGLSISYEIDTDDPEFGLMWIDEDQSEDYSTYFLTRDKCQKYVDEKNQDVKSKEKND